MAVSAAYLSAFYRSPLGQHLARAIAAGLSRYAPPGADDAVLGFGYSLPYLDKFATAAHSRLAFMPANMADGKESGAPEKKESKSSEAAAAPAAADKAAARAAERARLCAEAAESVALLPAEHKFPLPDAGIDCILAIHALEFCPDARAQLAELWRILAPNGRLILAVPNRRGLWARAEYMPFGHGQPYSRSQLAEALAGARFAFSEIQDIGHFLPQRKHNFSLSARLYSAMAERFFPYFGAVLLVEAQKRLYKPIAAADKKPRSIFMPDFAPQPAAGFAPSRRA